MFLSIIVPVYNAEQYLPECLDSLLNQDISDYEILCVNDGSRDHSLSVLEGYSRKDPRVRVINKENGGVTSARNAGLQAAAGDFIWFVDADDLVKPDCLGRLKTMARNCDRVIFGAYEFTDAMTQEQWQLSRENALTTNTSFYDSVVWRCLLRQEFLLKHDLFFRYPELTHGEDGLFMYEVTLCSPVAAETEEVLYFYRLHSGSAETAASTESRKKRLRSLIRVCHILHGYYESGAAGSADRLMSFLWMTLYDITRMPKAVAEEAMEELGRLKLFPFERPENCTISTSYLFGGPLGKVFDIVYLNLHRPWAFKAMQIIQGLRK